MKTKRFFATIACFMFIFNLCTLHLYADTVTPRWTNTRKVEITHQSIDGYACCHVAIDAYSGTTRIDNVDIKLYRVIGPNLTLVASWDDLSASGATFEFYDEILGVPTGFTYRLAFTADVHRNGIVESLNQYHDVYYTP